MSPELNALAYKVGGSLIVGIIVYVVLWPFKTARKEWSTLKEEQSSMYAELVKQRENCLTTLQQLGQTQVVLLGKVAATLEGVRLDLAEQTGYLRAAPPRRRSNKK